MVKKCRNSQVADSSATKPPAKTKKTLKDKALSSDAPKPEKQSITISWSASNQLYLTDLLLTAIEDSVTWCQVFGFSSIPGKKSANASHGKKTVDHYHDLASAIFHDDEKSPKQWKTMDIELLRESVKNRINNLKKMYRHHRSELRETGHGLVISGRTDEIDAEIDPSIANAWDKIQTTFPWYLQMHKLHGLSPVVDQSAVANSTSTLDLTVLDPSSSSAEAPEEPGSPSRLNQADPDASSDIESDSPVPTPCVKPEVAQSNPPLLKPFSKRSTAADQIVEALKSSHQTQMDLMSSRNSSRLQVAMMQIQWQREQDELARREHKGIRNHEMAMLEKQIQLECIQKGMAPFTEYSLP